MTYPVNTNEPTAGNHPLKSIFKRGKLGMKVKKMNYWKTAICSIAALAVVATLSETVQAAGWGTIKGQVILDGDAPSIDMLVKKGDKAVKDAAVCAADGVPDQSLVVNDDTKGVANIFIFLSKAKKVHPDLEDPKEKELVFDQKGCKFIPHAMFVRTDQTVKVISSDNCAHNLHTFPFKNNAVNSIIQPNDQKGIEVTNRKAEKLPTEVKCDIHPWMKAYWLILDHPYAVVTDADGKFEIKDLPEGEHKFRAWQEKAGYLELPSDNANDYSRGFEVEVKDDETVDLGVIKVSPGDFK